ncbi:hypothetical protein [Mesorhizobium sp. M7A.F.Ca.MR.148.00.0.0]|uniref:hypothetical protein n=1 Tax=Mesorhizobium sp. M7A.F.Ca.MR.148.00.0.0 TaxID=2496775 RepID=UPI001FE0BED9|nr:hypothetical protein [Mesorhizobium sp. M7A.F.Ca.MR.148.00.0.0]
MAEFKSKASAVTVPSQMWELEAYLREQRRDIDRTFDYRYSQLLYVFAHLIRAGYLDEKLLAGLAQDKLDAISAGPCLCGGTPGQRMTTGGSAAVPIPAMLEKRPLLYYHPVTWRGG